MTFLLNIALYLYEIFVTGRSQILFYSLWEYVSFLIFSRSITFKCNSLHFTSPQYFLYLYAGLIYCFVVLIELKAVLLSYCCSFRYSCDCRSVAWAYDRCLHLHEHLCVKAVRVLVRVHCLSSRSFHHDRHLLRNPHRPNNRFPDYIHVVNIRIQE